MTLKLKCLVCKCNKMSKEKKTTKNFKKELLKLLLISTDCTFDQISASLQAGNLL